MGRLQAVDGAVLGRLGQLLAREVGDPNRADLALRLEIAHGLHGLFNGDSFGIEAAAGPVELVKIEIVCVEIAQRALASCDGLVVAKVRRKDFGG